MYKKTYSSLSIVLMRHDIRRAKLHTINKMVKQSRKLKNKHGTEEQRSKYMRKYERLIEEIKMIKELKNDEISKFFLATDQDSLFILNDPNSNAKLKALAKVGTNDVLKASLYEFKKKYPNASNEVPLLLSGLGKRVKKRKKNKSENLKESNINTSNISPTKKKFIGNANSYNDHNHTIKTQGNNRFLVKRVNKRSRDKKEETDPTKKEGTLNVKKFKSNLSKIDQMDLSILKENKLLEEKPQKPSFKKEDKKDEIKIADPFFVTADNTEYMTVATSEKQIEVLKNVNENFKRKSEKYTNYNKFENNNNNNRGKFTGKKFSDKFNFKERFNGSKHINVKQENRFTRRNTTNNSSIVERLHPSWEAKKKQSGLIMTQFAGKKIVFED
ncbi:uncharacterized protein LOC142322086 isoform X2 [Lycorma delicatula]|uniref:uncharacterized protein LOC142322086 isoform X2 n=1 Tax=Lycorma delicatula TaxID=130591 RepID=UPI003F5198E4